MSLRSISLDQRQRRCGAAVLVSLIVLLAALGGRLYRINSALKPDLMLIARQQQQGQSLLPARRGMIFDARGRIVALSRQTPDVFIDPALIDDVDGVAADLAARINVPARDIADTVRARPAARFVPIASRVDPVTAEAVSAMNRIGVGLIDRAERSYPLGDSMAHVIGWMGHDGVGMEGMELAWDTHLRGRDGWRTSIRDARRRVLRPAEAEPVPPVDGGHLILTLDAEIQRIAESALDDALDKFGAENAVGIVMSPANGEILAMACRPAFNPDDPVTPRTLALRRNRAVTDPVEPGSAFKPLLMCGALERGVASPTEQIDCHMGTHYFGRRCVTDTSPHGMLDVRGIITYSSNIGMGTIAERMGNRVLWETMRAFGLGERTGVELPGESSGVVYPPNQWTSLSAVSVAMGYEVLVTPLQLVTAFAAMVNDGVLVRPRMVKALLGPDGEVVESFDGPQVVRRVVPSRIARFVARDLLVSVVENGSGRALKDGPYHALGKTGTAKLAHADRRGYEAGAYLSTFVGSAPVEEPRVVVLVMVRRPSKGAYYGSAVAAPVVGEIMTQTLAYLGVPPDEPETRAGL